jgi:hypothetical protein
MNGRRADSNCAVENRVVLPSEAVTVAPGSVVAATV